MHCGLACACRAVHFENKKDEDLNKTPWLDIRFRGSIFYNNPPMAPFPKSEKPLTVKQAVVDLGSGSELPPPLKNNKLPGDRMMEDVGTMAGKLN